MRRKVTRWISAIMIGTMLVSSVQVGTLRAEDNNMIMLEENEQPEVPQDTQSPSEPEQNSTGEDALPEGPDTNTESGTDADSENMDSADSEISEEVQMPEETEQEEVSEDTVEANVETAESDEIEAALNYLYINEAEQEEGTVQNIVLSWGNAENSIKNASIVVEDENGNATSLEPINRVDETFLYEHTFSKGTYHVSKVNIVTETSEKEFIMEELGVSANFGVGQSSNEGDKSDYMEMESVNTTGESNIDAEASVVSVDENGNIAEQDSIASAIGEQRAAKPLARVKARSTKASNVVVVLDPGHDSRHAGARGNGVAEEVAVLKIAQYCKEELEKYSGVTVHMTRNGAACPFPNSTSNIDDIYKRTAWAATKGADVFVSFHLNSAGASAKGAEVYYPSSSSAGQALAQQIQSQLVALGLHNRGAKGDASYAVVNSSMKNGFPGLIIEHAFVSNSSDANNYLKSDASLKKLGIADATGIAKYFGLSKGYWETDSKGNKYYYENGVKVVGTGKKIDGYWYYFAPETGIMQKNYWRDKDGERYYYDENGHMLSDIGKKIDGYWYYFAQPGAMQKNYWRDKDGEKYYYDEQGHMLSNVEKEIDGYWYCFSQPGAVMRNYWKDGKNGEKYYHDENGRLLLDTGKKIDGYWYYFAPETGAMQKNYWRDKDGEKYYYDENGHMLSDIGKKIDGYWHYFSRPGAMQKNYWRDKDGEKYYYDKEGHMLSNVEKEIDGYWYCFSQPGAMLKNYWKDGKNGEKYYHDENGRRLFDTGKKIDGYWYYFAPETGIMQKNYWREKDGEKYYYDGEGHMLSDMEMKIDGYCYYFAQPGAMQKNYWREKEGEKYYHDENGRRLLDTGKKIDGYWYYFAPDTGIMQKNYLRDKDGEKYYYDENGHMLSDIGKKIDGYWYYFSRPGAMQKNYWRDKDGEKYYYDEQGHMLSNVEKEIDGYRYCFSQPGAVMRNYWKDGKNGEKYYHDENGRLLLDTGKKIDGYWYYFAPETGVMQKNYWRDKDGEKYYYDENGHMLSDIGKKIDGYWHYFSRPGAMQKNYWRDKEGKKYYYDEQGHMVVGEKVIDGITYIFNSDGSLKDNAVGTYLIAGTSSVTVDQMVKYFKASKKAYPAEALGKGGADSIQKFCQIYYEECKAEGIKVEVAFAQAMRETGYLQFGGDVKIEQFNFAGLGAVGGGAQGASFKDVREGVRAQVQHLKCYANNEPLNNPCVDPRWGNWLRNKAPYVEWLSIPNNPYGTGWAGDPNYGVALLAGINKMKKL